MQRTQRRGLKVPEASAGMAVDGAVGVLARHGGRPQEWVSDPMCESAILLQAALGQPLGPATEPPPPGGDVIVVSGGDTKPDWARGL